jgi:hypothetical protein
LVSKDQEAAFLSTLKLKEELKRRKQQEKLKKNAFNEDKFQLKELKGMNKFSKVGRKRPRMNTLFGRSKKKKALATQPNAGVSIGVGKVTKRSNKDSKLAYLSTMKSWKLSKKDELFRKTDGLGGRFNSEESDMNLLSDRRARNTFLSQTGGFSAMRKTMNGTKGKFYKTEHRIGNSKRERLYKKRAKKIQGYQEPGRIVDMLLKRKSLPGLGRAKSKLAKRRASSRSQKKFKGLLSGNNLKKTFENLKLQVLDI